MYHIQGFSQQNCRLIAVLCGEFANRQTKEARHQPSYPLPNLVSSGRLEVHTLINPTLEEYRDAQISLCPNFLYFQGQQLENEEEIGSLVWGDKDVSDPQMFSSLVGPSLPTVVYLEVPKSEEIAQALYSKGVSYIVYWNTAFSSYAASHFRQALLTALQSTFTLTWDAFQLALASFRLYCVRNNYVLPANCQVVSGKLGPLLLGDASKLNIIPDQKVPDKEEHPSDTAPIKIHDEYVDVRFLMCGVPCPLDACLLGSLEDGLNALLNIEIRGSKLQNRVSVAPPPLEAGTISPGVVTVKCDLTTCSSAHISLIVSGSVHTCFDDQLLECEIKNEITEKCQLVHPLPNCEEIKPSLSEPMKTAAIASGASVFEVCMKVPSWAAKILCHLAPEFSYRSLVVLGIASVNSIPVASFEKEDADRLLFFCTRQGKDLSMVDGLVSGLPALSTPPTSRRSKPSLEDVMGDDREVFRGRRLIEGLKIAALKPIPRPCQQRKPFFLGTPETDACDGSHAESSMTVAPSLRHTHVPPPPPKQRKSVSRSFRAQQMIPLNSSPLEKHGCNRCPLHICSEEEFLRDVMQFLIVRGHSWLIPQGGISEFPEAILNAKRLDLFNLYREVVSRGGFGVGNGINWKGQVFAKMRNHSVSNRMTGVGNALKRHYRTYLLEYELAHDDVEGECCLLCNSSTPGDWVNCGVCGEWAHFGCDRRQGLGAFKDFAKTDGLEYVCPPCSLTNLKKRSRQIVNEFPSTSIVSWEEH